MPKFGADRSVAFMAIFIAVFYHFRSTFRFVLLSLFLSAPFLIRGNSAAALLFLLLNLLICPLFFCGKEKWTEKKAA